MDGDGNVTQGAESKGKITISEFKNPAALTMLGSGLFRNDVPGMLPEQVTTSKIRQGYIEIGNAKEFPLTLKVGRQILSYGDERLIGAFDWNNIGRTFDAAKLRWRGRITACHFAQCHIRKDDVGRHIALIG